MTGDGDNAAEKSAPHREPIALPGDASIKLAADLFSGIKEKLDEQIL